MKTATLPALLLVFALTASGPVRAQGFTVTNLVSDQTGQASGIDANLVNPWGLAPSANGVFWVANNTTGTSTLYEPNGTIRPLVVTIPGGSPTGVVATAATDSAFDIPNGATTARAAFIFVTQNGTIAAWNPNVNQTTAIQVSSDPGAVYTGAALGGTPTNPILYVADFAGGTIEAYDSSFADMTLSGSFTDPNLPAGYYPFNIANINGQLYVAYAKQSSPGEELPGAGLGIIDVFDMNGNFIRRFATGGELDAPWAIVQAPSGFGDFGGDILIGNFGDGRILAYNSSGTFQGALEDSLGNEIELEGLWGLSFGRPAGSTASQQLYFAAGVDDETHGLFGFIRESASTGGGGGPVACENHSKGFGQWKKMCGGPHHGDGDDNDDKHGNGNGRGRGDDNPGQGNRPGGADSDSLDAWFDLISDAPFPNTFGDEGCFTADCDLLAKVGRRTWQEKAAQVLLMTRLNLASGAVCDSFAVPCFDAEDDSVLMLGDAADSLDALLCDDSASRSDINRWVELLRCTLDSDDADDEDDGDDDDHDFTHRVAVTTVGGNPARLGEAVRFELNATTPSMVQMRIYDVRGRLVATPMQTSMVSGSASVTWDGTDLRGKTVAPGTYFYRAVSAGQATTGRFLIVR